MPAYRACSLRLLTVSHAVYILYFKEERKGLASILRTQRSVGICHFRHLVNTCLPEMFPNFTLKELFQILLLSLGRLSDILSTSLLYSLARSISA